jgi:MFS family permease
VRLGLRANLAQFMLLVGVNALVGGMIGQERTVLPLLGTRVFHLHAFTAALTFIVAFGLVKAATNFAAGTLSDRTGRKPVLVAGWIIGVPVPFLLAFGPGWGWIIAANVLLGINQGLTWSTTVIMKIDLAGPARRGLAMGLNEAAGYIAVALTALATGYIAARYGLRPDPFFLGMAFAGLGLGLSALLVRETRGHARHEAATSTRAHGGLSTREVFLLTSFKEKALSAASQAGLVNNLNDGLAWGIFPIFFARGGLSVARVGILVALYPAVWGAGQLVTGALSDRMGRKWLIAVGMWTQAAAIALIAAAHGFWPWAAGALLLGTGTAMVYPTLLAVIGDVAHPAWRASAVGVYRLWRDGGFAIGALTAGVIADLAGLAAAIWAVAALTAVSGLVVALRMYETHRRTPATTGHDKPLWSGHCPEGSAVDARSFDRWNYYLLAGYLDNRQGWRRGRRASAQRLGAGVAFDRTCL